MAKDIYTAISHDNVPFEEYLEEIEKCDINVRREGTGEGLLHYAVSNWSRPEDTAYVEDMIQRCFLYAQSAGAVCAPSNDDGVRR